MSVLIAVGLLAVKVDYLEFAIWPFSPLQVARLPVNLELGI
jgi:hypothetical protein